MMENDALCRFIDRYTVEYLRSYPHPIERVWRAVSDPAEVAVWFWGPGRSDARVGGAFHFGPEDGGFDGVISAFEPPRLIRYGFPQRAPDAYFQCELEAPGDGGTRLRFVQRIPPTGVAPDWAPDPEGAPRDSPWRSGTLSGWHRSLDHLGVLMDGGEWVRASQAERDALDQRYREHMLATQP